MKYRPPQLPPEAPESVRTAILQALHTDAYHTYKDSENFLRAKSFDPPAVVADVAEYIESGCRLWVLRGPTIQDEKYQCCLRYEELTIHVKMKRGKTSEDNADTWFVVLGFHEHNTGYPPLPE